MGTLSGIQTRARFGCTQLDSHRSRIWQTWAVPERIPTDVGRFERLIMGGCTCGGVVTGDREPLRLVVLRAQHGLRCVRGTNR